MIFFSNSAPKGIFDVTSSIHELFALLSMSADEWEVLCGEWFEFMPFIATSPTGHCPWPKVNKFRLWKTPQFWNNGLGPHEWSARGIKVYWIIPERLWHVRKGKLKIIYDPFIAFSLCLFKPFSPIMDPCINAKRFLILCQHKAS